MPSHAFAAAALAPPEPGRLFAGDFATWLIFCGLEGGENG